MHTVTVIAVLVLAPTGAVLISNLGPLWLKIEEKIPAAQPDEESVAAPSPHILGTGSTPRLGMTRYAAITAGGYVGTHSQECSTQIFKITRIRWYKFSNTLVHILKSTLYAGNFVGTNAQEYSIY